jgi:hypothetical protein
MSNKRDKRKKRQMDENMRHEFESAEKIAPKIRKFNFWLFFNFF